jgi:hypothetical protein
VSTQIKDWAQSLIELMHANHIVGDMATTNFEKHYIAGDSTEAYEAYRASAKKVIEAGRDSEAMIFADGSVYCDWKQDIDRFYPDAEMLADEEQDSDPELAAKLRAMSKITFNVISNGEGTFVATVESVEIGTGFDPKFGVQNLTIRDLSIDGNQGIQKDGRAFGYIDTDITRPNGQPYCGWFFTWPDESASISAPEEANAMVESLELDAMADQTHQIPRDLAEQKLRKMLYAKFRI